MPSKPKTRKPGQYYRVVRADWMYPADAEMHMRLTHHADVPWEERGMVDGPAEGAIVHEDDLPAHAISSGLKNDILVKDNPDAEPADSAPPENGGP